MASVFLKLSSFKYSLYLESTFKRIVKGKVSIWQRCIHLHAYGFIKSIEIMSHLLKKWILSLIFSQGLFNEMIFSTKKMIFTTSIRSSL